MKTLTLSAIALTLLASVANARDNDARDTYRWLNSVTQTQANSVQSNATNAYQSDVAIPQQNSQPQVDKGSRH